jgi:hypothetical protein
VQEKWLQNNDDRHAGKQQVSVAKDELSHIDFL